MNKRPFCKSCNKNPCAINYTRKEKIYYRSVCDRCNKNKTKKKLESHKWEKAGYRKKSACDQCGFKAIYPSQLTVYFIDGDLENVSFSNLRTVCLNCVEVIKRKEINWRRGDLKVDY